MKRAIHREADAFFAMSERAREALMLEGTQADRIWIIGNSVDTSRFRPDLPERNEWRRRFGIRPEEIAIVFIGRLHESKGVFPLVHAAWRLFQDPMIDRSRLRILMIGTGREDGRLRERIALLGLGDRVVLAGGVPHQDIHCAHSIADIFTLPSVPVQSWQEQFGIVLIESMASGKPIVAAASGSIPEVVGDCAMLVQPADHVSLYRALRTLVTDPAMREAISRRARRRAEEQFALDVVAAKFRRAFTEVLEQGRRNA